MKCIRCMTQEISGNKPLCAACLAKAPRATPRWAKRQAPLKIGFFAGDEHAPPEMQAANEKLGTDPGENETCILLDWDEAFTVLRRTEKEWEEFHPGDFDWQVRGWLMIAAGFDPRHLIPLSADELAMHGEFWPKLPPDPTMADYCAEVMIQYYNALEMMKYDNLMKRMAACGSTDYAMMDRQARKTHDALYVPLTSAIDAWTDTAMEQMSVPQGKSYRINQRLLYKAAYEVYEVHYLGGTKINPLQEVAALGDTTLLDFALTRDLIPGARKITPKDRGEGRRE